jgi:tRNA-dihydrouridine synthase A
LHDNAISFFLDRSFVATRRRAKQTSRRKRAIDRAPLHALRTTFVVERLGFRRDEALTFGRAVAGPRAYATGGSLGKFRPTPHSLDARGNAMQHDERIGVRWQLDFALAAQSRAATGRGRIETAGRISMMQLPLAHRLAVAPMMDWTDRHCRYFHRMLARHAWLYTEMMTTGALLHGDAARHLAFDPAEQPVAVQLGGSEPDELAACARLAERWGYAEVNLNCGCPSERVQRGAFGACLMAEPDLVADCVRAMQDAVSTPVTVKHRIGLDRSKDYGFVRGFVETLARAGCRTFFVHARNAWLKGLSPKENRELPPLRYDVAHRLKHDLPELEIVVNGGIVSLAEVDRELRHVDGVMLGRAAYHNPWLLAAAEARYFGASDGPRARTQIIDAMLPYAERHVAAGGALRQVARHMLGLFHGQPGARIWRRKLSDPEWLGANEPAGLADLARELDTFAEPLVA